MDTQENDSILKEIMKGIANINVLLLSIKSFNQNDISKLSQKLNNIRNEILDVAKKTKVIVSTEQTLINGEEEKKTSDKGTTSESNNVVEHGIRYLKAIPFSVIPAGNSIIEVLFKKQIEKNDNSDVWGSIFAKSALSFTCGCISEMGKSNFYFAGVIRCGLVWMFDPCLIFVRNELKQKKLYWFALIIFSVLSLLLNIIVKNISDKCKSKQKLYCCFKKRSLKQNN